MVVLPPGVTVPALLLIVKLLKVEGETDCPLAPFKITVDELGVNVPLLIQLPPTKMFAEFPLSVVPELIVKLLETTNESLV